jgi:hypothetical protein
MNSRDPSDTRAFDDAMRRIEELAAELERSSDRELVERARLLVAAMLEAHAFGIRRLLDSIPGGPASVESDPALHALLDLHGIRSAPPAGETSELVPVTRLVRKRTACYLETDADRCELCGTALAAKHAHVVDLEARELGCCCPACALLFPASGASKRRVEHRVERLSGAGLSDALFSALDIPIGLAFFVRIAQRLSIVYPSPAGAVEAQIDPALGRELLAAEPVLSVLEDGVEALLVSRLENAQAEYRVSIDECYELIGLVRRNWRGLGGGSEVRGELVRFFARLDAEAAHESDAPERMVEARA